MARPATVGPAGAVDERGRIGEAGALGEGVSRRRAGEDGSGANLLPPDLRAALDRLALLLRQGHRGRFQGPRPSPRHGQSVAFADFRPYSPGDDPRRIDWKAYARLERLFLRLFAAEEDSLLHLVLDRSRSMAWGSPSKLEAGKRLAAALGYLALAGQEACLLTALPVAEGDAADPADPADPVDHPAPPPPQVLRGRAAAPLLLRRLKELRPAGGTDLAAGLARHLAAHRATGPLVLVTDLLDPGWEEALRRILTARMELRLIHVLSPEELRPDLSGDLRLVDDETGQALDLSADASALAAYQARLTAWQAEVAAWCRARGALYLPLASDLPTDRAMLGMLQRAGIVG